MAREAIAAARGRVSLTGQRPWLVAFLFGLLHGFALAGALTDAGLPTDALPQALLLFNLGVELGQLFFVGAILFVIWVTKQMAPVLVRQERLVTTGAAYAIVAASVCWVLLRFQALVP